jgi:hypothetical protein
MMTMTPNVLLRAVKPVLTAMAVAASGLSLAAAETAPPPWQTLLEMQLQAEVKCVMSGTVFVREEPHGSEVAISGRALCIDGRMFDFSQSKPHLKFDIRACEPVAC